MAYSISDSYAFIFKPLSSQWWWRKFCFSIWNLIIFNCRIYIFLIFLIDNWFLNLCCIDNEGNCQNLKQFKIENLIKCHSNKGLKACILTFSLSLFSSSSYYFFKIRKCTILHLARYHVNSCAQSLKLKILKSQG